ncbi:MAG: hypothetical protein MJZ30_08820 [Paludibacteraceae bacterium]|nr:hypothetical protein [Paludibacteraceae bacterium]
MENVLEPMVRKSTMDITREMDFLLTEMKQKFNLLQFEQKHIQLIVNDLANIAPSDCDAPDSTAVAMDTVYRLSQADKSFKEAFYMIQEALSSIATGSKNLKESHEMQQQRVG